VRFIKHFPFIFVVLMLTVVSFIVLFAGKTNQLVS